MKKKTFKEDLQNPAMSFISQESVERAEGRSPEANQAPETKQPEPGYLKAERKSKRVQLLITPSLYEAIKQKAKTAGTSTNNYINYILKAGVEK